MVGIGSISTKKSNFFLKSLIGEVFSSQIIDPLFTFCPFLVGLWRWRSLRHYTVGGSSWDGKGNSWSTKVYDIEEANDKVSISRSFYLFDGLDWS